ADRAAVRRAELTREMDGMHADGGRDSAERERRCELLLDQTARALRPSVAALPRQARCEDDHFRHQRLDDHLGHAVRRGQLRVEAVAELVNERRSHPKAFAAEAGLAQPLDPGWAEIDGRQYGAA